MVRKLQRLSSASRSVRKKAPQVELGDQNVAGRGKAGSEVGETGRQNFRQRGGLVGLPLWLIKRRLHVHEHDRRPRDSESFRQRLLALEQVFGRNRRELAAEDPVLQVDQHEGR